MNYKIIFVFQYLLFFSSFLDFFAQDYQYKYINKSAMFGTASILQDYDNDGDMDIIVTRRSQTNDPAPSSVEWLENDGTGLFPRHKLFEELESPADIDMGDFNNDGKIDYVVSDKNQLILFIKQNDGSYQSQKIVDSVQFDQSVVADFNKDGSLDIVSVGFWLDSVSIYINEGNLNFSPKVIAKDINQVDLVEVADIDSDNDMDIVIGSDFRILYNSGSADFDSTKILYTTNGDYSSSKRGLTITDLNNDNILDILTFSGVGQGGMYFLDGSQNFSSSLLDIDQIDLGGDIVVADFDGNGLKDIVRQNIGDHYIILMYQISNLEFTKDTLELYWDNKGPGQMSLGDLDGDGDIDLIIPENGNVDGDISWFENIDGKLYRHYLYHEIKAVSVIKSDDIDNDNDVDIVVLAGDENSNSAVSENEIVWYENIGNNNFLENRIDDNILLPSDLIIADINKNGTKDIIVTAQNENKLIWYKKNNVDWDEIDIDINVNKPTGIAVADINSDTNLDIVLCSQGDRTIYSYVNNGLGEFTKHIIDDNILNPEKIIADDFNNDGNVDLALAASDSANSVVFYLNQTNGNFQKTFLSINQFGKCIAAGDWDNNGETDIVVSFDKGVSLGNELRDIAVFLNDGNASFTASSLIVMQNNKERTKTFDLVDIDHDNDLDLLFAHTSKFYLAKQNGNSELIPEEFTSMNFDIYDIETTDLNNDGLIDVLVSDQFNSSNNLILFSTDIGTGIKLFDNEIIPNNIKLYQNYPNPFNPSTIIKYTIPYQSNVILKVFGVLGREVTTLVNKQQPKGTFEVEFDGSELTSGIYFYRLKAGGFSETKKMILIK